MKSRSPSWAMSSLVNPSLGFSEGAAAAVTGPSARSWSASDCLRAAVWIRQCVHCLRWPSWAEVCLHAPEIEGQLRPAMHAEAEGRAGWGRAGPGQVGGGPGLAWGWAYWPTQQPRAMRTEVLSRVAGPIARVSTFSPQTYWLPQRAAKRLINYAQSARLCV